MQKGRHFVWGEEQQEAFIEIKSRLQRPPVLQLPDRQGRFQLYSDTSKFVTGSAFYQIQNGLLPMPARECWKLLRTIPSQN